MQAGVLPASNLSTCNACEPGKFQNSEGGLMCKPCERGGWCGGATAAVNLCPAGTYGHAESLVSEAECMNCSAGTSCPVGSKEETPCASGTYANTSASLREDRHVCIKCPAGTYQSSVKQTKCVVCARGGYCAKGAAAAPWQRGTVTLGATAVSIHRISAMGSGDALAKVGCFSTRVLRFEAWV